MWQHDYRQMTDAERAADRLRAMACQSMTNAKVRERERLLREAMSSQGKPQPHPMSWPQV